MIGRGGRSGTTRPAQPAKAATAPKEEPRAAKPSAASGGPGASTETPARPAADASDPKRARKARVKARPKPLAIPGLKESPISDALRATTAALVYAGLLSVVVNLLQLTVPVYMLQIYDRVMASHSVDTLVMLTLMACAALVCMALIDYIRARVWFVMGGQLARRLDLAAIQGAVSGWVTTQMAEARQAPRDLNELRMFITGGGISVVFDVLCAPLFLLVLFLLHPVYGLVAIASALLLIAMALAMEFIGRRPMGQANEAQLRAYNEINAAIRNGEAIEAMGMLGNIGRRWRDHYGRAIDLHEAGHSRSKAISAIARSLRLAVQVGMLATGVLLVMERLVTPGSMVAATVIMGRMLAPFEQLVEGSRHWAAMFGAIGRLRRLVESTASQRQRTPLSVNRPRLAVERCVFVPPGQDRAIIKGISFVLEPGDVLGVVGPSAAGKSTLARLLVGVWRPTGGGIYLDGHDVFTWERESFGRAVGYVPQQPMLMAGTVRENIARLADCDPRLVIEAARAADVHEMIGRLPFGYDTVIGEGGYALSAGQQQRIALARALFGNPKLLVLDEPNSNLDTAGERALLAAITMAKNAGATIVLIAHRPSVMSVADKLLVLKDGMIEQFGERTDVIKTIVPGGAPATPAKPPAVIDPDKGGPTRLVRT
jgi:ATP-binding cassette subfamily C protein